jgi:putative metalloprotease
MIWSSGYSLLLCIRLGSIMNRRELLIALPGAMCAMKYGIAEAIDVGGMLGAAKNAARAVTLTDEEVRSYAAQMALHMDKKAPIAPAGNPYSIRMAALTKGLENEQNLRLNYKVYLVHDVNAFAMADGTIRVFSGLMDLMTDDEIRYVIGHEIGHVSHGHTKKRIQTALAATSTQQAVSASGSKHARLADGELGNLIVQVVQAQHSQANEREADDYALKFMARKKLDKKAAVSALEKLAALAGGGTSWLSTHPSPRERAQRMRSQIG